MNKAILMLAAAFGLSAIAHAQNATPAPSPSAPAASEAPAKKAHKKHHRKKAAAGATETPAASPTPQ